MWLSSWHELLYVELLQKKGQVKESRCEPWKRSQKATILEFVAWSLKSYCAQKMSHFAHSTLGCKLQMTQQILTVSTLLKLLSEMELSRNVRSRRDRDRDRARLGEPQCQPLALLSSQPLTARSSTCSQSPSLNLEPQGLGPLSSLDI